MRVYFVRHGERADNSDSIFASRDIPITELGKRQAGLLAERFASIPIDAIYASPYVRTRETAEIINAVKKTGIRYDARIEELGREEELANVFRRANSFVSFLENECVEERILVSAHAGIIKMIVFAMVFGELHLGGAFKEFDRSFHMDFTGITYCTREKPNPWHIVSWNDLGHLPPPV
ncbi:MAG TPA: histidine phosphatase family protein [Candidatus Paceibacterota bacterium]|nr:histidine phosphatase family protein [Candidatus Paceibacterota bacterium]